MGRGSDMKNKTMVAVALPRLLMLAAQAAANPYSGMDDQHVQFFRSPSGNIQCEVDWQRSAPTGGFLSDQAYCISFEPLQSVAIHADGSFLGMCKGDTCGSNGPTDQGVLQYGERMVLGPSMCLSKKPGMTCTANGRGFQISKAGIVPV